MLGLDPDPGALWPGSGGTGAGGVIAGAGGGERRCSQHCRALIDATAQACVAVKPQLARFEVLGAAGWAVLEARRRRTRAGSACW